MDLEKILKNNRTKLRAITGARLEHQKETASQNLADRVLPFLHMPTPEEISAHPALAGTLGVLEALLSAKLMKDAHSENKRNEARTQSLLDEEEKASLSEQERIQALMDEQLKRTETEHDVKTRKGEAEIKKIFQDIEESKARPGLEAHKAERKANLEEQKAEEEEARKKRDVQYRQVQGYKGLVSPEVLQQMLDEASRGEFNAANYKEKPRKLVDFVPFLNRTFGTGKDRYEREVKKTTKPSIPTVAKGTMIRQINKRTGEERLIPANEA